MTGIITSVVLYVLGVWISYAELEEFCRVYKIKEPHHTFTYKFSCAVAWPLRAVVQLILVLTKKKP